VFRAHLQCLEIVVGAESQGGALGYLGADLWSWGGTSQVRERCGVASKAAVPFVEGIFFGG
jgi:hypothetical protein